MTSSLRTVKYYMNREQSSRENILLPFSGIDNSAIKVNRETNINQTHTHTHTKTKSKKRRTRHNKWLTLYLKNC